MAYLAITAVAFAFWAIVICAFGLTAACVVALVSIGGIAIIAGTDRGDQRNG